MATRKRQSLCEAYNCLFTEEPPNDLMCQICLSVARDPQQSSCCGKLYCKSCLEQSIKYYFHCPNCRKRAKSFADVRSDRQIKSLKVSCKNEGCKWGGTLQQLMEHTGTCSFALVQCPNKCPEKVQRQKLDKHMKEECILRKHECPQCKFLGTYDEITRTHPESCPEGIVSCPNGCSMKNILRKDLRTHRSTCPKETIYCRFYEIGCKAQLSRKDMKNHEQKTQAAHLQLAAREIVDLRAAVKMLTQKPLAVHTLTNFAYCKAHPNLPWDSPTCSTPAGYMLRLRVWSNGTGPGTGTHLSVAVYLCHSPNDSKLCWPAQIKLTVELLNQLADEKHVEGATTLRAEKRAQFCHASSCFPLFVALDQLESSAECCYLRQDRLYFRISIREEVTSDRKPWLQPPKTGAGSGSSTTAFRYDSSSPPSFFDSDSESG